MKKKKKKQKTSKIYNIQFSSYREEKEGREEREKEGTWESRKGTVTAIVEKHEEGHESRRVNYVLSIDVSNSRKLTVINAGCQVSIIPLITWGIGDICELIDACGRV